MKSRLKASSMTSMLFVAAALCALPTLAQDGSLYSWTAPSSDEQLAADTTTVPAGSGAVFVPSFSSGQDEPEVIVRSGDDRVATGTTGKRIVVPPGSYMVLVGSGPATQMTRHAVEVSAGQTASVEPTWAGLKIEVVDTNNVPHRGTYEVIRMEDREVMGIGYGADLLQGEKLQTWLLGPGLYRIVRSGETYRARKDFATVELPESGLVHFRLVQEPTTGEFRGAGVVSSDELSVPTSTGDSPWSRSVSLGGALSLSSTDNVVGATNQSTFNGLAFLDTYVTYEQGQDFASAIFELEEGIVKIDPEVGSSPPAQKSQDRLRFDLLYTRYINDRWGPYVRLGLLTNVFPSSVLATEDSTVAFNNLDGTTDTLFVAANDDYRTSDGFGALRVREGIGANFRLMRNQYATLNWRVGAGFRQNNFNNAYVLKDLQNTPEFDYFEVGDFNEEGVETTLNGSVRLLSNLLWVTDLEVFGDFGDLGDPTIDWRNTLSLRFTRTISVDYTADVLRQPQVIDATQLRQNILLRFSFDLL